MKNTAASMRARLLTWAKEHGIQFQYASMLYMQEGILSRLAASEHSENLILKGGFLIFTYAGSAGRTTKDIDFLGHNIPNDENAIAALIGRIVGIMQDDGLIFNVDSIRTERITEGAEYHGVRVLFECQLGSIKNRLQVDIGFGDAVTPKPARIPVVGMLRRPTIEVVAYPLATVIAEKFEIMIALGSINSRMKDFFDVAYLLDHYVIPESELKAALIATFKRRQTNLPDVPIVFSTAFESSRQVQTLWDGFLKRTGLGEIDFSLVVETIRKRLKPLYMEIHDLNSKQ